MLRNWYGHELCEVHNRAYDLAFCAERTCAGRHGGTIDAISERDRLSSQPGNRDVDLGRVSEFQRRLKVALGAHRRESDALAIDDVGIRLGADARAPQLFERDVKEMEEARVVDD